MANRKVVGVRRNVRIRKDYPATFDDINELQKVFGSNEVISEVPILQLEEAQKNGLNPAEAALVYSYTGSWYWNLNKAILAKPTKDGAVNLAKTKLNKALNKLPKYEGLTYRAMGIDDPITFAANLEKMGTFKFTTFTSTSTEWGRAENWGSEEARILFEIEGKSGRNVKRISMHDSENEVLFKAGTKFKFMGYTEKYSTYSPEKKYLVMKIKEVA